MNFPLIYIISTICSLIFFYLLFFCSKIQEKEYDNVYYDTGKRGKRTIEGLILWFILSTLPVVNSVIFIISVICYCIDLSSESRYIIDHPIIDKIAEFLKKEV